MFSDWDWLWAFSNLVWRNVFFKSPYYFFLTTLKSVPLYTLFQKHEAGRDQHRQSGPRSQTLLKWQVENTKPRKDEKRFKRTGRGQVSDNRMQVSEATKKWQKKHSTFNNLAGCRPFSQQIFWLVKAGKAQMWPITLTMAPFYYVSQ